MSFVAISGQVMEKLVSEARDHPDEQIVGVLLGRQSGSAIVIDEATTGPSESNSTHATLTGDSIAKIADDIISKRIEGSIVGWYHSHVRGGVFMSETDVETQLKLQQFSPLVAAMVIDAQTGKSSFFRADGKTKEAMPVRSVTLGTETAPASAPASAPTPPPIPQATYPQETYPQATYPQAMYPQAPAPQGAPSVSTRTIILAVVLIVLALTAGVIALIYYRGTGLIYTANLAIAHTSPPGPFSIGSPITFDANVTGSNLQNVTLEYRILARASTGRGFILGDLIQIPMLLKAAGGNTYSYTIPGSEISGVYVRYQISAFDTSNNVVRTGTYDLALGDFDWHSDTSDEVTVVRTITSQVRLAMDPINGFNRPVTIRVAGAAPAGVSVRPVTAQVTPPNQAVLEIRSTSDAELVQKFPIEIDAVFSPTGVSSVQILRSTILVLTVADFDLNVSPTFLKVIRPQFTSSNVTATYTMTLRVYRGFTVPNGFTITVTGLPTYTSYRLQYVSYRVDDSDTTETAFNVVVTIQSGVTLGTYVFQINFAAATAGGTISHLPSNASSIQLEIASS